MGAFGDKPDALAENDKGGFFGGGGLFGNGGRGGGGGGGKWFGGRWKPPDWMQSIGPLGTLIAFLVVYWLFKPITAILVNLVYYVMKWPTGREPGAMQEEAKEIAADADIIARYGGADDDEDFDDDDDDDDDDDE